MWTCSTEVCETTCKSRRYLDRLEESAKEHLSKLEERLHRSMYKINLYRSALSNNFRKCKSTKTRVSKRSNDRNMEKSKIEESEHDI